MPAIVNAFCQPKAVKVKSDKPKSCVVSHAEFVRNANVTPAQIAGGSVQCKPFEYSTGSFGWLGTGKVMVKLANGVEVPCQVDIKLFVVNSKVADRTPDTEANAAETVG